MRKEIAVLGLVLALACATVGRKMDLSLVDRLQPGISTQADAVALLGQPTAVVKDGQLTSLSWAYAHANAFGHAEVQTVTLTFGPDGKLVHSVQGAAQPR